MALTRERLAELLEYDPITGKWIKLVSRGNNCPPGIVGDKCLQLQIDGKLHKKSRLAWLYMTGKWPEYEIDHVNCDPRDDRWVNLREADRVQNCRNRRKRSDNLSGIKGVQKHKKCNSWRARIMVDGRALELGRYNCPAAAYIAYVLASSRHFGEFSRP
jgi:hypothetical protein